MAKEPVRIAAMAAALGFLVIAAFQVALALRRSKILACLCSLAVPSDTTRQSQRRLCTAEVGNLNILGSTLMNMDTSTVVQVAEAT